jgi:TonB family protein
LKREESFVLDFSRQEEIEQKKKEAAFKEDISKRLDDLIAAARSSREPIRNIAVDAGSQLKDDRNTDADQLYKDAERLAKELKAGQNAIEEDAREETVDLSSSEAKGEGEGSGQPYSGASVLSYRLDGRKARHLPIPAYKCYGGGDVVVIINVDQAGRVVGAQVNEAGTSGDACMKREAVKAAKNSRFSGSPTAPNPQVGEIVYRFIAQ